MSGYQKQMNLLEKTFLYIFNFFIVIGLAAFVVNWLATEVMEPIVLIGYIFLALGINISFIAFLKNKKGVLKIISGVSLLLILVCLVWIEPLLFVYILTWLKHIF